jgi:type IV pili sensor histidine kinase/response regulator
MTGAEIAADGSLRLSRYQTMTLQPHPAQVDLLSAVIDIEFTADVETVGAAVAMLLKGSGYGLSGAACQDELFGLQLPSVHRQLGPLPLRHALEVLSGPGWRPAIDRNNRSLSFERVAPEGEGEDERDRCHCA